MSVQFKDYYATLGVPKGASQDEIRTAFRKLARQYHPDVAKEKKGAEAKFKEINEAYEVLSDGEKRQKYDTLGPDWERMAPRGRSRPGAGQGMGGGASFGGTGFSDFFEQFFAGRAGRSQSQPFPGANPFERQRNSRGEDVEADLLVTIEEALRGAKKKISFRGGDSSRVETYEVAIPKGVREGQRIRLAGKGEAGATEGRAGDLFLRVRFERHPLFRADGANLVYELELPAWKAVLGCEVSVPTPDGEVRLKIPPTSQQGRKLRLKGRGLPVTAEGRGDFYVQLEITLPTETSAEERQTWEKLGSTWR